MLRVGELIRGGVMSHSSTHLRYKYHDQLDPFEEPHTYKFHQHYIALITFPSIPKS